MGFSPGYDHGNVHKVVEVTARTYTITPDQSGFTFIQNNVLGTEFTLPADTTEVGFHCKIVTKILIVPHGGLGRIFKITTGVDGQLMLGSVAIVGAAAKQDVFLPNGSSHDNIIRDALAEGGGPGQWFECTLVGVDKWLIHGHASIVGSGTPTSPWSNG